MKSNIFPFTHKRNVNLIVTSKLLLIKLSADISEYFLTF